MRDSLWANLWPALCIPAWLYVYCIRSLPVKHPHSPGVAQWITLVSKGAGFVCGWKAAVVWPTLCRTTTSAFLDLWILIAWELSQYFWVQFLNIVIFTVTYYNIVLILPLTFSDLICFVCCLCFINKSRRCLVMIWAFIYIVQYVINSYMCNTISFWTYPVFYSLYATKILFYSAATVFNYFSVLLMWE